MMKRHNLYKPAQFTAETAIMAALLVVIQLAMSPLPNIEAVSLLILLFTAFFPLPQVLLAIYTFVFLEGLIFGFHIWWISYLYVWTILCLLGVLCKNFRTALPQALLSGMFGLSFGFLCAWPYFFMGGAEAGFAYWVSGIPFDLLHGVGNFAVCLLLYKPLYIVLHRLSVRLSPRQPPEI